MQVNTIAQVLQMMLKGRVDVIIINPLVAKKVIAKHIQTDQQQAFKFYWDDPVESYSLYAICAKTNPHCRKSLARIDRGLSIIKQSNDYQKIVDKYERTTQ